MEVFFSAKYLKYNLLFGILQLVVGIISLIFDLLGPVFGFGWLVIGIMTLTNNYHNRKNFIIKIENNLLIVNPIFYRRKILLSRYNKLVKTKSKLILSDGNKTKNIQIYGIELELIELLYNEIEKIINKE